MSYGDEIMAAGQAEAAARNAGGPVAVVGRDGRPRRSDLWQGNPAIADDIAAAAVVENGPGCRPYIAYPFGGGHPYRPSGWRARDNRGRLFLTSAERAKARQAVKAFGPFVMVEPHIPGNLPNKDWGFHRFEAVVEDLADVAFVQCGPEGTRAIPGAFFVETPSFRAAAAVLAQAIAYLGPDGGLHHAAAALAVPAVVIFGAYADPEYTGYPEHLNLTAPGDEGFCGRIEPCRHCRRAMASITPAAVAAALRKVIGT